MKVEIADKERQIVKRIGELIATAPDLDSPPTLPDMIQKLKLIQLSFERSLRQDLTQLYFQEGDSPHHKQLHHKIRLLQKEHQT